MAVSAVAKEAPKAYDAVMRCGKRIYWKLINAKIALMDTRRRDRSEKRIYFCSDCHGYHLTSRPGGNNLRKKYQ